MESNNWWRELKAYLPVMEFGFRWINCLYVSGKCLQNRKRARGLGWGEERGSSGDGGVETCEITKRTYIRAEGGEAAAETLQAAGAEQKVRNHGNADAARTGNCFSR